MGSDNRNFADTLTPRPNETPQVRKPWRTPKVILETVGDYTNTQSNVGSDGNGLPTATS